MSKPKKEQKAAEHEILLKIARKGSSYFYPFHSKGKDYIASRATIYRAKENLENNKLIKFLENQKSKGRKRKIYSLTAVGVCRALATSNLLDDNPEAIAENWGHLIPVLKKLPLFDKHNLKWRLLHYLRREVKYLIGISIFINESSTKAEKRNESIVVQNTNKQTYKMLTEKTISPELGMKYNKILQEDPELREGTKRYLRGRRGLAFTHVIEATERLKLVFPLLESDNPDWNEIQKTEESLRNTWFYDEKGIIEYLEALVTKKKEHAEHERKA